MNVFTQIEDALATIPNGWCTAEKARTLAAAVLVLRPKTVVEIGVFGGRSFIPMAIALKHIGEGVAIGIDPWSAKESQKGQDNPNDFAYWSTLDHGKVYDEFMRDIERFGLTHFVHVVRAKSDDVKPPSEISLLHSDGNHSIQALTDVRRFAPNITSGGFCFLDDCDWSGGAVRKAESHILSNGFKMLFKMDTGAMYQKS